jgi:hypothetical protein
MISVTELVFGILTISPAEYAGPDPGAVVPVAVGVAPFDEPESSVQPAARANSKRTMVTIEIFLIV